MAGEPRALDALSREELVDLVREQQAEIARLRGEAPAADHPAPDETPLRRAAGALVALLAAGVGEYFLRTQESPLAGIALYCVAALLLAATSARFALRPPAPPNRNQEPYVWWIALGGAAVAATLATLSFLVLRENLREPAGFWLWMGSLLVLALTGAAVWPLETPSARWQPTLPRTRRGRRLLAGAILLILVAAIVARVYALDRVPLGINPDEGDRTATAMQIVRGTTEQGIFESGWYRISMMYFTLLARWLEWTGIGYVQARLFTVFFGVVTVAGVLWIGLRQWGARVGLAAGAVMALMGLALQFSRETSEAGPTAALWTLSMALLLEGARTGRLLPWLGAGLAGGYSLYFYPTGRTWPLLALVAGIYLLVRWRDGGRDALLALARNLGLAALASVAVAAPFFAHALRFPDEFALRFAETSALRPENAARLYYIDPEWSAARLLVEQLGRSLGVFSRYPDGAGFWPMREPVLGPVLAVLALLGLGLCLLRWRDPRSVTLGMWFGVGFVGMVLTVETPNVQRMATAVPALALFVALSLEEVVQRAVALWPGQAQGVRESGRRWLEAGSVAAAALLLAGALAAELRFYFGDYARMSLWTGWNQEGRALTLLPPDTLHLSLGDNFHMVNSGWVRLLAPDARRGGIRSPGSMLPLAEDGERGLSFLIYPGQPYYLPWVQGLYPGARPVDYALAGEDDYFAFLYVPASEVAATRGARVRTGAVERVVETIGAPAGNGAGSARWEAQLRVSQSGNYSFRLGSGPAALTVDGQLLLEVERAAGEATVEVSLARGDHGVMLEGPASGAPLAWARVFPGEEPELHSIPRALLTATGGRPQGFAATVEIEGLPAQRRQDNTLATCCLGELLDTENRAVRASWEATLQPWEAGVWTFTLTLPSPGRLLVRGVTIAESVAPQGETLTRAIELAAAPAPLRIEIESDTGANGPLLLVVAPPSGAPTVLPASSLTPASPLVGAPLPDEHVLHPGLAGPDTPLETIE